MGTRGVPYKLLDTHLNNRHSSGMAVALHSVPQESVLGPLLYDIYVSYLSCMENTSIEVLETM